MKKKISFYSIFVCFFPALVCELMFYVCTCCRHAPILLSFGLLLSSCIYVEAIFFSLSLGRVEVAADALIRFFLDAGDDCNGKVLVWVFSFRLLLLQNCQRDFKN
jgi:hypothetical protein